MKIRSTSWEQMAKAWIQRCPACGESMEAAVSKTSVLECVNSDCAKSPYRGVGKEAARDPTKN